MFHRGERSARYYRNAVERHLDPATVDLGADARALERAGAEAVSVLHVPLAKFCMVTTDLSPLQVLDPDELSAAALEKLTDRLARIIDGDRSVPPVEALTSIDCW